MSAKKKNGDCKGDSKVQGLSADQRQLFADIIAQHDKPIKNYIRTKVHKDLVEDLCQTAFLKALDSFHTLHDVDKAFSWLRTIAGRVIAQHYENKWNKLHESLEDLDGDSLVDSAANPQQACEQAQEKEHYQQARSRLKEPYATLLKLHYEDELSYKKIAEARNASYDTIKKQLVRGKEKLKEVLEPAQSDENNFPLKPHK